MGVSRRDFLMHAGLCLFGSACRGAIVEAPCAATTATCQTAVPPSLQNLLNGTPCELVAFDDLHRATASSIYRPATAAELGDVLEAWPAGRHITFRGGGHSFDSQALGTDLVIVMAGGCWSTIGDIQNDDAGYFMTAGAGARWWDVVAKVAPYGLMPPSLVTAGDATVGGTLSADCLSRMSPVAGKEGSHVRSFRMVLADGRVVECKRHDPLEWKRDLFYAVIGGYGSLGAVVEVTFDLAIARSRPNQLGPMPTVLTRSTRHEANVDWDALLRRLQSKSVLARKRFSDLQTSIQGSGKTSSEVDTARSLASAPEWSALSIASFFTGSGMSANLLEQRYSEDQSLRPCPGGTYDKDSGFLATSQNIVSWWPTLIELALDFGFPDGEFVDELFGWAFFVGNSSKKARAIAHQAGRRLNIVQQTWLLPVVDPARVDTGPARRFIELLEARLHGIDVRPTEVDFLYIPQDEFLMSASRNLDGFAITAAFTMEDLKAMPSELNDLFCQLTHDCRTLGGRVHLVKNVTADRSDLRAMHGDAAAKLRELKKQYDPKNLFVNEFFTRVFDA